MLYIHRRLRGLRRLRAVCPVEAIFYDDDVRPSGRTSPRQRGLLHRGRGAARLPGGRPTLALCCATPNSSPTIRSQRPKRRPRLHAGGWAPQRSGRPCGQGWPAHAHCWRMPGPARGQLSRRCRTSRSGRWGPARRAARSSGRRVPARCGSAPLEVVVVGALAQQRPQVVPGAGEQAGVELAVGRQARRVSRQNG